jgi:hypothetical protein
MPRELFVVARDRADLYRYLSQTFAEAENVDVSWDRRQGERRRLAYGVVLERRCGERRSRFAAEQELRTVGYAFLALD